MGIVALAWAGAAALGSLGAVAGRRLALHDRLTGSRVVSDW
jgi:hypothetical protein